MSTHRPVDVLPDRRADTVTEWLTTHPGARVICRDRAGAYAETVRAGAPEPIEVADRWHLLHNPAEAVEKTVATHHHCLRSTIAPEPGVNRTNIEEQQQAADEMIAVRQKNARLAERTECRFADVSALKLQGLPISAICREPSLARNTVRRFYRAADVTELLAAPAAKVSIPGWPRSGRMICPCCTASFVARKPTVMHPETDSPSPYSSRAVEGHVNRIEMLERQTQTYGRAGFDLLRKRILLSH
ncbi:transposase [Rhodococcus coprophilus]|uniref:Putative transposase for insertion sequence element n=2 Tax=Rhodococcus coprophilus TaxID=38310 RepID=A0A2X4UEX6_9NOCA|nr:putative transposase for insertion sequence element [Rhodococcus coprophilus]